MSSLILRLAPLLLLLAFAGCSSICVQPGRLADLGSGRIAGIPIDEFDDLPSEGDLDLARYVEAMKSYQITAPSIGQLGGETRSRYFSISEIKGGELRSFRVEYGPKLSIALVRARIDGDTHLVEKLENQAPVYAVTAEPYWGDGPPALQARAARIGIEVGELAAVTEGGDPLLRTSHDGWYALLGRGDPGEPPRLRSIVAVYSHRYFHDEDRLAVEESDRILKESPERIRRWAGGLALAKDAGSKIAADLCARLAVVADARAAPRLSTITAQFRAATLERRLVLLQDAASEARQASELGGGVPPQAAAAVEKLRGAIIAQLPAAAKEARGAGRSLEADSCDVILACLGRHEEDGAAEVLPAARELAGMRPAERINRLRDLHRGSAAKSVPLRRFVAAARSWLARDFERTALAAAAAGCHATACCRFLLAYGLHAGEAGMPVSLETLEEAHGSTPRPDDSDLVLARREALLLVARLLPFVDPASKHAAPCEPPYGSAALLRNTALVDRLGLVPGDSDAQARFARAVGADLLDLEIDAPQVTEIKCDNRTESLSASIYSGRYISNTRGVNEWSRSVDDLEARINRLEAKVADGVRRSRQVTGTVGWHMYEIAGKGEHQQVYDLIAPSEGASSILARGAAASEAAEASDQRDALVERYNALIHQRPPDTVWESHEERVPYARRYQDWTIRLSRTCRLKGKSTSHEATGTSGVTVSYARVAANPRIQLEAVDEWRTEDAMRADEALLDTGAAGYAAMALGSCLGKRLDDRDLEVHARGLSDVDAKTERAWLRYLFTDQARGKGEAFVDVALSQDALVAAAFTGESDAPLRATPTRRAPPEARSSVPREWYDAALKYWEAQSYPAAKILMAKYVEVEPKDSVAWMVLAGSHAAMSEYREAIAGYRKVRELTPDFAVPRLQLALMHAMLEEWDAAKAEYDACLPKASAAELAEAIEVAESNSNAEPGCNAARRALELLQDARARR